MSKNKEESKTNPEEPQNPSYEELLQRVNELEGMKDRLMRGAADFENAKKRLQKDKEEFIKFSQESLIRDLLPVLDNFERALVHAGEAKDEKAKALTAGIQLVQKQLNEILKSQGLKRLQTKGQIFDPHQHEAVSHVPEAGREDEITDEIEPGYLLHDRLLRPAKVRVRVKPPENQV
jgi:molecular chaperone GrpE